MLHSLSLRFVLCLAALPALAQLASAQNVIVGGPGNSTVVGTPDHDDISDPSGGDCDSLDDGGMGWSDGKSDHLNSTDGDNNDTMTGGPEDTFLGDANDWVQINSRTGARLWQGPFNEYQRIRRAVNWLKSRLLQEWSPYPYYDPRWVHLETWQNALSWARQKLVDLEPVMVGDECDFAATFALESEAICDECWSPEDFWNWFPGTSGEGSDGTEWLVTSEQFQDSVADAQFLLDYLLNTLEGSDASDG